MIMAVTPTPWHIALECSVYETARQAAAAGISIVPIRNNGTKQPALSGWREYQKRRANSRELKHWFSSAGPGIAFITGAVSGNLEALDFDSQLIFEAWLHCVQQDEALASLYDHVSWGYLESTPAGGKHLLYRCDETVERNQKLACRLDGETRETLIETRGEGGLIIVAPSRGQVHVSGKPYTVQHGGISSIRTITAHQRSLLFTVARAFNTTSPTHHPFIRSSMTLSLKSGVDGLRPGDVFNQQASWEDVLIAHGWQHVRTSDGEAYWRRPGKRSPGISATTNHHGHDLLYVFSTSTVFECEKGYTKFGAYTFLNHNGDFSAAARDLAEQGYVTKKENYQ